MRYAQCRPLIVDDDADYRLLLCRAFQKAQVPEDNLRIAGDGMEAVRILDNAKLRVHPAPPVSLVVLDLHLPGMSGLDVLAWIRSSSASRDLPVFLLSSSEDPDHVGRAFDLGTDSYFVKPADFTGLQTIVEGMLGHWCSHGHRSAPGNPQKA
jgi:DNA-binding response OmpR family regulator